MFIQSSYYSTPTPKIKAQILTPLTAMLLTSTVIFMMTLLIGLWAAYDLAEALIRFAFIAIGLAMMLGIAWFGRYRAKTVLSWVGTGCAFWAAALGMAYGLRFNYNSGAVASGLMVLLPLALPGLWWQWRRCQRVVNVAAGSAFVVAFAALLLTFERTAWAGLAIGLVGAGYLSWRLQTTASAHLPGIQVVDWLIGISVLSGLAIYGLLLATPAWDGMIGNLIMGDALVERLALWRESMAIGSDYYFTGSGLGMTAMIYSTYVISMHTPYWYHAHNLYLQLVLEQGVPGLLAFLGMIIALFGMIIATLRNSSRASRWFCLAASAALLTVLGYGLLDAELYATSTVTLLFIPAGFILALYWAQLVRQQSVAQPPAVRFSAPVVGGAGMIPIIALLALGLEAGAVEKFYTNLAVLTQTKMELSRYHWPIWPMQDALRRKEAVDLSAADHYYQKVLALNAANPTVHQRLGQIALSKGDYAAALAHLTYAYRVTPTRNSLRRLLGEAYAVTGNIEQAAWFWQSVHLQEAEIEDRLWWYGYLNEKQEVHWIEQALAKVQF